MTAVAITTFSDLLADLAEKIGETSTSTEDNRKRKINSAYNFVANKRLWWWTESSDATTTTTTALSYTLPTDFRVFHPLNPVKIGDDWQIVIPFKDLQLWDGSSGVVSLPSLEKKHKCYIYGSSIYFVRDSMTAGSTITYYYYKNVTLLDNTTDQLLMPVSFREMISLYAAGMHLKSQGGKESVEGNDYLQLFDTYLKDMQDEDDNRRNYGVKRRTYDPEEALVFQR